MERTPTEGEQDLPMVEQGLAAQWSRTVDLCRELNRLGAKYIVTGADAMRRHGADRLQPGLEILIDGNIQNQGKVLDALDILPEKAAQELRGTDLREYVQIRVADSIVVDLAMNLSGTSYEEAETQIEWGEADGVRIPYASLVLLWKTKQNHLEEDESDRIFLREKLKGILPEEELHSSPVTEGTSEGFLGQIWRKIF